MNVIIFSITFLQKDNDDIIYSLVEMLLSIEQVWSEPNIPSVCTLSTDPSLYVIFEESEIPLEDIVAAPIQPPSLILTFDKSSNTLQHLSIAVRNKTLNTVYCRELNNVLLF